MAHEKPLVSAVIPTHNPDASRLRRTLLGLAGQSLPRDRFETILVDNASASFPSAEFLQDCALDNLSVVREPSLGLTAARLAGFAAARADLVVLVDDDNVLAPDYLEAALRIAADFPFLGTWSGAVELAFEPGATPPPEPLRVYLTERRCTQAVWSNDPSHHDSTPWGAGMCVRRSLAEAYRARCAEDPLRLKLDLSGKQLVYGGDTDIAYFGCSRGLGKGVFPQLRLSHLIPPERCTESHLLRAVEGRAYSENLHHWVLHGTLPAVRRDPLAFLKRSVRMALSDRMTRACERAREAGRLRAAGQFQAPR